jgi:hypothetical protein
MPSFSLYREAIPAEREPRAGDLVFLRVDKLDRRATEHPDLHRKLIFRRGAVALVELTTASRDG